MPATSRDAESLDALERSDPWSTAALASELELEAPLVEAEQSAAHALVALCTVGAQWREAAQWRVAT
jgi:hypothetical protein